MLKWLDDRYPWLREKVLTPFAVNVNPDVVSVTALLAGILAGASLWQSRFLSAAVFIFLNGFLDVLDGFIAETYDRDSRRGDFLDHTIDRVADQAFILGAAFSPVVPTVFGVVTAVLVLSVSYMGTQAQAVTGKRVYAGVVNRANRTVLLFLAAVTTVLWSDALFAAFLLLAGLSLVTVLQRFAATLRYFQS